MCPEKQRPVIAFLTSTWLGIDDQISAGKPPGGVPSVYRIWSEALAGGYEVHVFLATYFDYDGPPMTDELGGVHFHWIAMPFPRAVRWMNRRKLKGAAGILAASKVLSVLWQARMWARIRRSAVSPDLIYLMRPTFALIGRLWARHTGAKIVLRQYGTWVYDAWVTHRKISSRLHTLGEFWAMKMPFDLFIITNDGSMGDRAARIAGIPHPKLRFWLNGVDKTMSLPTLDRAAARGRAGIDDEAPVLLTLGRLAFWKRIDRLIDALPTILTTHPHTILLIAGDGPLRRELQEQAVRLGVTESVVFLGSVPNSEISFYMHLCDIFLIDNDLTNLCNTLLEAMICGCCIVTRDTGDTALVAHNGANALVLSANPRESLADAVSGLLSDSSERTRLGVNACEWALVNLQSWDERMQMEMAEIDHLISEKYDHDESSGRRPMPHSNDSAMESREL